MNCPQCDTPLRESLKKFQKEGRPKMYCPQKCKNTKGFVVSEWDVPNEERDAPSTDGESVSENVQRRSEPQHISKVIPAVKPNNSSQNASMVHDRAGGPNRAMEIWLGQCWNGAITLAIEQYKNETIGAAEVPGTAMNHMVQLFDISWQGRKELYNTADTPF